MSGYGAEKYADWEPVDRHASNALQLAQDTYYMKLPKSSSTVSVEDAWGSDEAIWISYDEAYRRANELALPAAEVGDYRKHPLPRAAAGSPLKYPPGLPGQARGER